MKIAHQLEPLMHIKEKSDNIQTFGCIQINLLFMLKPDGVYTPEEFIELVKRMMKASCDVIEAYNKEGVDICPGPSVNTNPGATILSEPPLEK